MNFNIDRFQQCTNRGYLTCVLLLGLLSLMVTHPVSAQVTHDFRLLPDPQQSGSSQPAYFVYESTAGSVIKDAVLVRNESDEPLYLSLFAADSVTASHGGVAVGTRMNDQLKRAGAWIALSQTELTLTPSEDRSVPFTLSLAADLPPGEYAASIVAQRAEEGAEGQTGPMGVRFIPRFAVTVLVTVPSLGADALLPHLEITNLRAATGPRQQTVIGDLSNNGNDSLDKAEGSFTVRRPDGVLMQEMRVRLGYFLAHDDLDYRIGLEQELPVGEYDVTLSLTHRRGTVELTRRLYLGKPPNLPIIRPDGPTPHSLPSEGLPLWVFNTIGVAGISIAFLMLLLAVQSRELARTRL